MGRLVLAPVIAVLHLVGAANVPLPPASAQTETAQARAPSVEEMFGLDPLLTTSLADARTGAPGVIRPTRTTGQPTKG